MARVGEAARNIQDFFRGLFYFSGLSAIAGFIASLFVGDINMKVVVFIIIFIISMFLLFKYAYNK